MSAYARSLIARALHTLGHIDGKSKTERRAIESVRALLSSADRELAGVALEPLGVPDGAREGISATPRAEWRRR